MRTFVYSLASLATAAAVVLASLGTAHAASSLSSSQLPTVPSVPNTPPSEDPAPAFQLTRTERDLLERSIELNYKQYYLRGGGMPRVTNDNLAVEASRDVAGLEYSSVEGLLAHASYSTGDRVVSVARWDLEAAYFDRGEFLRDVVAPDRSGLNYGTHVISDKDYLYVITVWTVSPFPF